MREGVREGEAPLPPAMIMGGVRRKGRRGGGGDEAGLCAAKAAIATNRHPAHAGARVDDALTNKGVRQVRRGFVQRGQQLPTTPTHAGARVDDALTNIQPLQGGGQCHCPRGRRLCTTLWTHHGRATSPSTRRGAGSRGACTPTSTSTHPTPFPLGGHAPAGGGHDNAGMGGGHGGEGGVAQAVVALVSWGRGAGRPGVAEGGAYPRSHPRLGMRRRCHQG